MRRGLEGLLSRRRLMTGSAGAAAAALSGLIGARASALTVETARGRVFEAGDAGLGVAGVMVSNGRDVVLTDAAGGWSLPICNGDAVFVIKPAHWSISGRGFYLHNPFGTPAHLKLRGPVVAPTGALRLEINFALVRAPEPKSFDVLLVADPQPANATELGYVRKTLARAVEQTNPAFAISHGDVMADDLSLFASYLDAIDETGRPWLHCPGNHDMNLDANDPAFAFEAWKQCIGPTHTAYQYADATFILLNNVLPLREAGRLRYRGHIGKEQLSFVANVLRHTARESLVVVSTHIPLVSFESPNSASDTTDDYDALMALLAGRPHTVSFSGHAHATEHHYLAWSGGSHHHHVLTAACGSWWSGPLGADGAPISVSRDGTPKGFHVLSVDGHTYTTRFAPFDAGLDPVARIFVDPGCGDILVNAFDGGPRTRVACADALAPDAQIELNRVRRTDPYVVDVFARHPHLCKPWVTAAPSSHIWAGQLPAAFVAARDLLVTIVDEYGRTHVRRTGPRSAHSAHLRASAKAALSSGPAR